MMSWPLPLPTTVQRCFHNFYRPCACGCNGRRGVLDAAAVVIVVVVVVSRQGGVWGMVCPAVLPGCWLFGHHCRRSVAKNTLHSPSRRIRQTDIVLKFLFVCPSTDFNGCVVWHQIRDSVADRRILRIRKWREEKWCDNGGKKY